MPVVGQLWNLLILHGMAALFFSYGRVYDRLSAFLVLCRYRKYARLSIKTGRFPGNLSLFSWWVGADGERKRNLSVRGWFFMGRGIFVNPAFAENISLDLKYWEQRMKVSGCPQISTRLTLIFSQLLSIKNPFNLLNFNTNGIAIYSIPLNPW
jgi:hypothetical protein